MRQPPQVQPVNSQPHGGPQQSPRSLPVISIASKWLDRDPVAWLLEEAEWVVVEQHASAHVSTKLSKVFAVLSASSGDSGISAG